LAQRLDGGPQCPGRKIKPPAQSFAESFKSPGELFYRPARKPATLADMNSTVKGVGFLFSGPLVITFLSVIILGEKVGPRHWVARWSTWSPHCC